MYCKAQTLYISFDLLDKYIFIKTLWALKISVLQVCDGNISVSCCFFLNQVLAWKPSICLCVDKKMSLLYVVICIHRMLLWNHPLCQTKLAYKLSGGAPLHKRWLLIFSAVALVNTRCRHFAARRLSHVRPCKEGEGERARPSAVKGPIWEVLS